MTRPKVTLHIIMPNQISGPNSAVRRISESELANRYDFTLVTQTFHAGGRINVALIRDLKRQFEAVDPDLVHLTGLQASGFHAVVAARLATRAPILVTIRGFSTDALSVPKFQRLAFALLIEPATLALCSAFVTVTRAAGKRRLVRAFRRKYLGAVHNSAPAWPARIASSDGQRSARIALGLPADSFIATVTGRMVTDKGIPTILETAEQLPLGFTICLVGDGPWLEIIRARYSGLIASERIVLLGQRSDVREILSVSDVFLFATLHENLSNALLEAMSIGLPTIVTRVGGNPEVVRHGVTGYLVEPGDASAMARHLVGLQGDPMLRSRMGQAGRARIEEAFSQDLIYDQLARLYDRLLEPRRPDKDPR